MKGLYPIRNKKLRAWWNLYQRVISIDLYVHLMSLNMHYILFSLIQYTHFLSLYICIYLTSDAESSKASNINFAP